MDRRPLVAANWKMHGTLASARALADEVLVGLGAGASVEVVLCPPFTALAAVAERLRDRAALGAQDVHWEREGAYTGEISASMLVDLGCRFVIVGHSERRHGRGENDEEVARKTRAAVDAGLTPIVCVGETLSEREAGRTERVVGEQVERSLEAVGDALDRVVLAYEPVWAIGTGKTATAAQAQEVHATLRRRMGRMGSAETARGTRILYGGSVKPDNAAGLFAEPDVDGGLIGGASLDARAFVSIVRAAGGR